MKHLNINTRIITFIFLLFISMAISNYASADTEDLRTRPDTAGTLTQIKVAVIALDIDSINGAKQTFSANVAIIAEWKDDRLIGQPSRNRVSLNTI